MPETGLLGGIGLVQLKAKDKVLFEKPHGKSSGEVRVKLWDLRTQKLDLVCVCLCPASSSVCVPSSSACQHGERLSNKCLWRSLSQSLHTLPSALIAALSDFHLCSQAHPSTSPGLLKTQSASVLFCKRQSFPRLCPK
jgi:hypothetical protein